MEGARDAGDFVDQQGLEEPIDERTQVHVKLQAGALARLPVGGFVVPDRAPHGVAGFGVVRAQLALKIGEELIDGVEVEPPFVVGLDLRGGNKLSVAAT